MDPFISLIRNQPRQIRQPQSPSPNQPHNSECRSSSYLYRARKEWNARRQDQYKRIALFIVEISQ